MLAFCEVTGTYSIMYYFAKCIALHAAIFETSVRFNLLYSVFGF
jgi:hypothetical protein